MMCPPAGNPQYSHLFRHEKGARGICYDFAFAQYVQSRRWSIRNLPPPSSQAGSVDADESADEKIFSTIPDAAPMCSKRWLSDEGAFAVSPQPSMHTECLHGEFLPVNGVLR